jgi:hypothetical protein
MMLLFFAVPLFLLQLQTCFAADMGINGKKETTEKGIEYVWEAPSSPASKILFLAHGCSHSAKDFWPSNPKCLDCVGLPEERRIVAKALASNYFVVAISSGSQDLNGCWDTKNDMRRVMRVLALLKKEPFGLRGLPVFALGASSGGKMVAALASRIQDLAGMCIQINAPDITFQMNQMPFPPSQWIYMEKDTQTAKQVVANVDALKRSGALVESVHAKQIALTNSFFSDRIKDLTPAVSEAIYDAFKANSVITDVGYLRQDPRHSDWRHALEPMTENLKPDSLAADKSPISEELNVAYAMHELTAEHMDATLAFFDKAAAVYLTRSHGHEHKRD